MGPFLLQFDVTDALPPEITQGTGILIRGWLFVPDLSKMRSRPVTIMLRHGGLYDKRYFHFNVPGRSGYSAAEFLCDRGNIVILTDVIGVGDSSRLPRQRDADRHVAALANHAFMEQFYARLRSGDLHDGLPPISDFLKVGGGHSNGGMNAITEQANHRTYDRLLILGYTAVGVHLRQNGQHVARSSEYDDSHPDYYVADRSIFHATFHHDDVPEDVVAIDDSLNVEWPYKLGQQATYAGIVKDDVGKIDVPIYICLADHDVSPDPHAEPGFYRGSPDVTLHILPNSGHCQNFAGTRLEMYNRIDSWIGSIDA